MDGQRNSFPELFSPALYRGFIYNDGGSITPSPHPEYDVKVKPGQGPGSETSTELSLFEVNIEKVEPDHYLIEVLLSTEEEEYVQTADLIKAKYTNHWVLLDEDGEPLAIFSTLEEAKESAPDLLIRYMGEILWE